MKEKPIIFKGEMVRAILDGRKTQTRRFVRHKYPLAGAPRSWQPYDCEDGFGFESEDEFVKCPYGKPGDRLWVRETFHIDKILADDGSGEFCGYETDVYYRASDEVDPDLDCSFIKWTPSIHMPRLASRINLEITDIRVERLQDISEEDAKAEGITPFPDKKFQIDCDCWTDGKYKTAFQYFWNEKFGWAPNAWGLNPWVWVISFKRI